MKKKLLSILLTVCMVAALLPVTSVPASAAVGGTFTIGDYKYTILSESGSTGTVSVEYSNTNISGAITIPSSVANGGITYTVTAIKNKGFFNRSKITSVVIPDSVTSIDERCFYGCSSITSITMSKSITNIGVYAFYGCKKLSTIDIPSGVSVIPNSTFNSCTALTSITIPSGVKAIMTDSFNGCSGLNSVTIPSSVTFIRNNPFAGCSKLTTITVSDDNPSYSSEGGALYSKDKTTLIAYPSASGSVSIPASVTSIGQSAFLNATNLTSVTIPDSVTSIGISAFEGTSKITSITIPNSISTIGAKTFYNAGLTNVTIPSSVKIIGPNAFNTVIYSSVIFKSDEMPTIFESSFNGTSISVDTTQQDPEVKVDIKGYRNNKSISEEKIWMGELLKPEVSGYSGEDELYYRFEGTATNSNRDATDYLNSSLSFYTSDTSKVYDGGGLGYMRGEAYAAIRGSLTPQTIKCSVYTWDSVNKKMILIASKQYSLDSNNFITDGSISADKDFDDNFVYIMQQGETTTVADILAKAGFPHVICNTVNFSDITTSKYSGMEYLTVNEISGGSDYTTISASTEHSGLSVLSFDYYTTSCTYHNKAYSSATPKKVSIPIYVLAAPEFDTTKDSITVTDKTLSPATSTYKIGYSEAATEFTDLNPNNEYDVLQTVSLPIGQKTYTGVYHNYVDTKKEHAITNESLETAKATNNGFITLDKEKAGMTEKVTITSTPNDGYKLVSYKAYKTGDETTIVPVVGNTFTMPDYPVTVKATFAEIPTDLSNAEYKASLTLTKNMDVNFFVTGLSSDPTGNLLITVDDETVNYEYSDGKASCTVKNVTPNKIGEPIHIVVSYDGTVVKDFYYSVAAYCDAVLEACSEGDAIYDLCEAIVNYGKYAADYANGNTLSRLNEGHEVDPETIDVPESSGGLTPNALYGGEESFAAIYLDSTIRLSYILDSSFAYNNESVKTQNFFILNEDLKQIDPGKVSVTCDSQNNTATIGVDLYAYQLANQYTLKVKGVDTTSFSLTYGVYDYCSDIICGDYDAKLQNLCKMIYNYGEAVQDYIN